ncbi:hypothetical protein J5N97_025134 [Dioscorea zingiberensis]|uniref:Uncharacterized protein n=1 Tax=Dioscorea zingiberensis TaxID=325984 RepID=A0A9D5C9A5_9LILI|nr:hypothetical protein J5N97_025134 [Dioscorea zingiberensis]
MLQRLRFVVVTDMFFGATEHPDQIRGRRASISKQLNVAQKITSIALATRVSKLEAEASHLRQWLAERDDLIAELRTQVETLDASASQASQQLARAQDKKVTDLSLNCICSPMDQVPE